MRVDIGESFFRRAMFFLVVWYVFLCAVHFLSGRPLWNDEQCVFNSIRMLSPHDLFHKRLLDWQVFPRLYLFLIQTISRPFDYHAFSLRLLPFLSMMAAFAVWMRIAAREFDNRTDRLMFALCWPASVMLVYYSAELKPYSFDILAASLVVLFLQCSAALSSENPKRYLFLLTILPFLGFMSYPALLMMFVPLICLTLDVFRRERNSLGRLIVFAASLGMVVIVSYQFDIRLRDVTTVTEGFGDYFISTASPAEFFKTTLEGISNLFSRWIAESPRALKKISRIFFAFGFFYMFYGFVKRIKTEKKPISVDTMALVIFAGLFLLGLFRKYPFTVPRTSLFFCPLAMMLTIKGIGLLKGWNRYVYFCVAAVFVAFLLYVSLGIAGVLWRGDLGFASVIWG